MNKSESRALFQQRKNRAVPRTERPRCGAKTCRSTPCQAHALLNKAGRPGRCRQHGGLSTGPRTRKGKAANKARARQQMLDRWAKLRAEGMTSIPLSPEGLERRRHAARRGMLMRHRKREALEWADWLDEQWQNWDVRCWHYYRRQAMLKPFMAAIESGGLGELADLSSLIGINVRGLPDGTELTAVLMAKYAPRYDLSQLAADFRKGAQ